ncbi:hypothetical protein AVEN_64878-1 [Araneus ventricosus]|uniref:Uncharacterized protein n=1 Tax=Araneus ventricosus TaxID=182803 RepID=A0A4Y2U5F1_ARAVE|nr:hypothetical protein AVEN_64878-1 [Araneus ventricosus]
MQNPPSEKLHFQISTNNKEESTRHSTRQTAGPTGSESNFEIKSSMFKLRDSARRYLEEVRQSGWDLDKIEQALLNPPDLVSSDTGKDDQEMDFLEDPGSMADENAVKEMIEQLFPSSDPEKPFEEGNANWRRKGIPCNAWYSLM